MFAVHDVRMSGLCIKCLCIKLCSFVAKLCMKILNSEMCILCVMSMPGTGIGKNINIVYVHCHTERDRADG